MEQTPTLESILNDADDRASLSEDEMSNSLLPVTEVLFYYKLLICSSYAFLIRVIFLQGTFEGSETLSLGSMDSRSRSSSERRQTRLNRWPNTASGTQKTGSILRHVILKGISTQLVSACVRYI